MAIKQTAQMARHLPLCGHGPVIYPVQNRSPATKRGQRQPRRGSLLPMTNGPCSIGLACVLSMCVLPIASAAQDELSIGQSAAVQSERLAYDFKFGGVHIADILAEFDEGPSGYRTVLTMETRGLALWFRDFRAKLTGHGTMVLKTGQGPTPVPEQFDRYWAATEIAASLTIAYDPVTGLARSSERVFNPLTGADVAIKDLDWNRGRDAPLPVPDAMRMGVFDPMAAFVAARRHILNTGHSDFRVPIYDGRRRYDLVGTVDAPRMYWIKGEDVELIPVIVGIEPVFGFDQRRTETMRDSFGKFLFSPNDRFIPVQVILEGTTLTSVMNLTADCRVDTVTCQQIADAGGGE